MRIEKDSLGEVMVPEDALYGAQTQRAVENFPISTLRFSRPFIRALGLIKAAAATVNDSLSLLEGKKAAAIRDAAMEVAEGKWDAQFVIDIFQTGSGTSTNMNANEVIAHRANEILGPDATGKDVHPNDDVNLGQSSNDVIPAAIHVAACLQTVEVLLPALQHLRETLMGRAAELDEVVKTGRTHLMDAMPVRMSQEIYGWVSQVSQSIERIEGSLPRMSQLALGGTAVGTGVNSHKRFGAAVAEELNRVTGFAFQETEHHFSAQATLDSCAELSGQLKASATSFMKLANDLRWMNSGPICGLGEIALPALQPGSSIMPGKVNPVICEAMMMVCAQVMGNDVTVSIGNSFGNFQLNVMMPVVAHNLLESITILGTASNVLADKAVAGFTVNKSHIEALTSRNPILATALNPVIGYDLAAKIAKKSYAENRSVNDVAEEMTELERKEIDRLLNPRLTTEGGL